MMPSAGRDGWWGAFIVGCFLWVCGNEKSPVSSIVVDGTGLVGVVWSGYLPVEP